MNRLQNKKLFLTPLLIEDSQDESVQSQLSKLLDSLVTPINKPNLTEWHDFQRFLSLSMPQMSCLYSLNCSLSFTE